MKEKLIKKIEKKIAKLLELKSSIIPQNEEIVSEEKTQIEKINTILVEEKSKRLNLKLSSKEFRDYIYKGVKNSNDVSMDVYESYKNIPISHTDTDDDIKNNSISYDLDKLSESHNPLLLTTYNEKELSLPVKPEIDKIIYNFYNLLDLIKEKDEKELKDNLSSYLLKNYKENNHTINLTSLYQALNTKLPTKNVVLKAMLDGKHTPETKRMSDLITYDIKDKLERENKNLD